MRLTVSFLFFLVILICTSVRAWIRYDTLTTTRVAPGAVYQRIVVPDIPWSINVLTFDLTSPFLHLETVKAQNRIAGYEGTRSMAMRSDYPGHRVVAAINGDFFAKGGIPINAQVINGQLVHSVYHNDKSTIGFYAGNNPFMAVVNFSGEVITPSFKYPIRAVNQTRKTNDLILYNSFYGDTTGTNKWGEEIKLRPLTKWLMNDTTFCIAEKKENYKGSMAIPDGGAVLSGNGLSATFLDQHIHIGDTLAVVLSLHPARERIEQLTGGFPRIIRNGEDVSTPCFHAEGGKASFATDRHPRTAVGFSRDSRKMFFVVVDGRQVYSKGMSLTELAGFMQSLGAFQAINLDGGGSSTLVVRNRIKNSPSDGHERQVANAWILVSSAGNSELNTVQIEPDNEYLFMGDTVQFKLSAWDSSYNPLPLIGSEVTYDVSPALGPIDKKEGLFVATANGVCGYVYCRYRELLDSAKIHIEPIERLQIQPEKSITDTIKPIDFKVQAFDREQHPHTFNAARFTWDLKDSTIGMITSNYQFKGKKAGTTRLIVRFGEVADTAYIEVRIGEGRSLINGRKLQPGGPLPLCGAKQGNP